MPAVTAPPLRPDSRLQFLPGVGPKRALLFEKLGLNTVEQLLRHYPRDYLDARTFVSVKDLRPGELLTVVGTVRHAAARADLGWSLLAHQRPHEADAEFARALELDPIHALPRQQLAWRDHVRGAA